MSRFKRLMFKFGIDHGDFNDWLDKALRQDSPHKPLMDRYDRSLKAIEIAEARLEVWVMVNVDKPGFRTKVRAKGQRIAALERASVAVLEDVFRTYRQDRQGR
jgi:hypothetical protein